MMLLAPAHFGSIALDPIKKLLWPIPFLLGIKLLNTPSLNDVDKTSPYCKLDELLSTSQQVESTGNGAFTISDEVVWAIDDKIVDNNYFLKDKRPPHKIPLNHSEVCKPTPSYMSPVELLCKNA